MWSDNDNFKYFKSDMLKIMDGSFLNFDEKINVYFEKLKEGFVVVKFVIDGRMMKFIVKEFELVFILFLDILGRFVSKSFLFLLRVDFKELLG